MSNCNVCGNSEMQIVFKKSAPCVSSVKTILETDMQVIHCGACNHVQAINNVDLQKFYDVDYEISLDSDDHDQLHLDTEGNFIERTKLQAQILMTKMDAKTNPKVLEFGCGKATTLKHLSEMMEIQPYVFDVSDSYRKSWDVWINRANQATYSLPNEWKSKFDVICLHYVLEHVAKPVEVLRQIKPFLAVGGMIYLSVPNFQKNIGDLFVVDHINKFTKESLEQLASKAGYSLDTISDDNLDSAWIVVLSINKRAEIKTSGLADPYINTLGILSHGTKILEQVEKLTVGPKTAIFGAGFYGALLANSKSKNIKCFLDNNIHLQDTKLYGFPVYAPSRCPDEIETVIFALNPKHVKSIISENKHLFHPNVRLIELI